MNAPLLRAPLLAADAFEAMIESAIVRPGDLYILDGETVLRNRDGRIETSDIDLPFPG